MITKTVQISIGEKQTKNLEANKMQEKYVSIYFDLNCEDNWSSEKEFAAVKELQQLLNTFCSRIENEGHDQFGNLICSFTLDTRQLKNLQKTLTANNQDGILYLENDFTASSFEIVEQPGLSQAVPFDNWDSYNLQNDLAWSHGYNAGNFSEAYNGIKPVLEALETDEKLPEDPHQADLYKNAFILGYYGTYEDYEVPSYDQELFQDALNFAAKYGYDNNRD